MCWCRPEIRTPWCGLPGCVAPAPKGLEEMLDGAVKRYGSITLHYDGEGNWWFENLNLTVKTYGPTPTAALEAALSEVEK